MKYIKANWPVPPQIKAYTTLRDGWFGRNEALSNLLPLPKEPIWLNQKHTTIAIEATSATQNTIADASFTTQRNQVCAVTTADCLPILLCNKQGNHVAVIHGGWRGLAQGIIENTLDVLHLPPTDVIAWLGPAIGPKRFAVGNDVYDAFTTKHAESASAFYANETGSWFADLYQLAKIRLQLKGITQVFGGDFCTYTQKDMFYSYRRDKNKTGHMATVIWIDSA